jgi:uracil-DNA glycosylase
MNTEHIKSIFAGVDETTKDILTKRLKTELVQVIKKLNDDLATRAVGVDCLCPPPSALMNMFRECSVDNIKVVLVGQDPYIRRGEAMGLSFSVPRGVNTPPSLRMIYKCLQHCGLIADIPSHGDLSGWARQGVLLLNCALTTVLGASNSHADIWKTYTDGVLRELAAIAPPPVFILLGGFAHAKCDIVGNGTNVLKWGHPSPLNFANKEEKNPKNFIYCDVFTRANGILTARGLPPINWNPDFLGEVTPQTNGVVKAAPQTNGVVKVTPQTNGVAAGAVKVELSTSFCHDKYPIIQLPTVNIHTVTDDDPVPLVVETLWLFTDGGARRNGKKDCESSWAFYATDGCNCASLNGLVAKISDGELVAASNNRGELTAIAMGLRFVSEYHDRFFFKRIKVVSDSKYSITAIRVWCQQWMDDPVGRKIEEKKNLDIIIPAKKAFDELSRAFNISIDHIHSHQPEPSDTESE